MPMRKYLIVGADSAQVLTKIQEIIEWATMLKNGADPLRATEIASFTTDPQQFTVDSMEMIKKIQESYAASDSSVTETESDADKIMQDNSDQSKNSPLSGKL